MDAIDIETTDPQTIIAKAVAANKEEGDDTGPVAYLMRDRGESQRWVIGPWHEDICSFMDEADWQGQTMSTEALRAVIGDHVVSIIMSADGGHVEWVRQSDPRFDEYLAGAAISGMIAAD